MNPHKDQRGIVPIVAAGMIMIGAALALLAYEYIYLTIDGFMYKSGW